MCHVLCGIAISKSNERTFLFTVLTPPRLFQKRKQKLGNPLGRSENKFQQRCVPVRQWFSPRQLFVLYAWQMSNPLAYFWIRWLFLRKALRSNLSSRLEGLNKKFGPRLSSCPKAVQTLLGGVRKCVTGFWGLHWLWHQPSIRLGLVENYLGTSRTFPNFMKSSIYQCHFVLFSLCFWIVWSVWNNNFSP